MICSAKVCICSYLLSCELLKKSLFFFFSLAGPSSASQPQPGVKHLVISRKSMVPRQTPPSFVMKAVTSKPAPGPTQLAMGQSPAQLEQAPATHAMAHSASIIPVAPSVPVAAAVDMHQIVEQSEVSLLSASEVEVLLQNSQEVGLESQVAEEEVSYHEEYVENYDEVRTSLHIPFYWKFVLLQKTKNQED